MNILKITKTAYISLLILSWCVTIALGILLLQGGVNISYDNRITNHNEQYQQQWQGLLSINTGTVQGEIFEWAYVPMSDFKNVAEFKKFKESLHPFASLFGRQEWFDAAGVNNKYGLKVECFYTYPNIFKLAKVMKIDESGN